ncbi:hypothetical protein L3X38_036885 [Prunus dulcis]|uniref:Uncharacterized protein n=1 Tax=Prunus dulcis TaxID=3755 RepID=A0AAD4V2M3_PRUDU|nr:hypothetical protein L3X38_036885 [Prunus dulcis]
MGNNPYPAANQFQVFPSYNQFSYKLTKGLESILMGLISTNSPESVVRIISAKIRTTRCEETKQSTENAVQDLIDWKILKFSEKATMGVDQNPFPNAQVNMVNANFPRPDQPRPRLDLGGLAKATVERRPREIPADPKARGKAKMHPKVAKVPETKVPTKKETPKEIVL